MAIQSKRENWQTLHDTQLTASINGDVLSVREAGVIRIFCGVAHPDVYDASFVKSASEMVKTRKARLRFLTGPMLVTDGQGFNAVHALLDSDMIDILRHRHTRGDHEAFWLVETDNGYQYGLQALRHPTAQLVPHQLQVLLVNEAYEAHSVAGAAAAFFDESLEAFDPKANSDLEKLPITVSEKEAVAIRVSADKIGLRFNHLRPDTIRRLRDTQLA